MDSPIIIDWMCPLSLLGMLGVIFILFFVISFFEDFFLCKQNSPRLDTAFCGVTSWAMLFAYVPEKGRQTIEKMPGKSFQETFQNVTFHVSGFRCVFRITDGSSLPKTVQNDTPSPLLSKDHFF